MTERLGAGLGRERGRVQPQGGGRGGAVVRAGLRTRAHQPATLLPGVPGHGCHQALVEGREGEVLDRTREHENHLQGADPEGCGHAGAAQGGQGVKVQERAC